MEDEVFAVETIQEVGFFPLPFLHFLNPFYSFHRGF